MNRLRVALLIPVVLASLTGSSVARGKPNIALAFMDNFGWGV